jgi:hypothetical protein
MNGLKGWAGVLSRDWVAETRRVLEVRQAVDVSVSLEKSNNMQVANKCSTGDCRRGPSPESARPIGLSSGRYSGKQVLSFVSYVTIF